MKTWVDSPQVLPTLEQMASWYFRGLVPAPLLPTSVYPRVWFFRFMDDLLDRVPQEQWAGVPNFSGLMKSAMISNFLKTTKQNNLF